MIQIKNAPCVNLSQQITLLKNHLAFLLQKLDLGFSKDTSAIYVVFGSAWMRP
jgi:hypothetical protein